MNLTTKNLGSYGCYIAGLALYQKYPNETFYMVDRYLAFDFISFDGLKKVEVKTAILNPKIKNGHGGFYAGWVFGSPSAENIFKFDITVLILIIL